MSKARQLAQKPTQPTGRKNLIINGAMQVAQRGTSSGSLSSNGVKSIDRFSVNASGGTYTISQQDFTVGQTDVPDFPKNYLKMAVSTGNNNIGVHQRLEDVTELAGKTVTLSFWAKGTNPAGGNFASSWIQNFGSGGSTAVETEVKTGIVLTSSWQKITMTVTLPSVSGKTIGVSNYLWVDILRQPNSDTGTSAWTADIAQVQLEVGSVATEFEHRSYGEELALCQRYYHEAQYSGTTVTYGTYVSPPAIYHPVTMRATPQLTFGGVASSSTDAIAGLSSTVTGVHYSLNYGFAAYITSTSTGYGWINYSWEANSEL